MMTASASADSADGTPAIGGSPAATGDRTRDDTAGLDLTRLPAALRILQRDIVDLADLIHSWRDNLYSAVSVRSLPADAAVSHASQWPAAEGPPADGAGTRSIDHKCGEIQRLLAGMRADLVGLFQTQWVLEARIARGGDADGGCAVALHGLRETAAPARELLARFHALTLTIAHHEMSDLAAARQSAAAAQARLDDQVEALHKRLKQARRWRAGPTRRRAEAQEIQAQIYALGEQRLQLAPALDRRQILRWLDALVNAELNSLTRRMASKRLAQARELLLLLLAAFGEQMAERATHYSGRVPPSDGTTLLRAYFRDKASSPDLGALEPNFAGELMRLERDWTLGAAPPLG